jgi:DNA (cytosine-5)-methyltransferase 1
MKTKFNIISLFSGAGGFDIGFDKTKCFQTLLSNEILSAPVKTIAEYLKSDVVGLPLPEGDLIFPISTLGDVKDLDFSKINHAIDVLIGGPPCQDFTIARGPDSKRLGLQTGRGQLYLHFLKGLEQLRPKVFVFENVPGILTAQNGEDIKTIRADLSSGYTLVFDQVVNCTHIGLPQMRKRMIIVGIRKDLPEKNLGSTLNSYLTGAKFVYPKYPMTPLEFFNGKPLLELEQEYKNVMSPYIAVCSNTKTDYQRDWITKNWSSLTRNLIADYININNIGKLNTKEFDNAMEEHASLLIDWKFTKTVKTSSLKEKDSVRDRMCHIPPGANYEFVRGTEWEVKGHMSNIYRRIHPLKPSPTVIAKGGGGTWGYHYDISRCKLNNEERARLQSFPDGLNFFGNEQEVRSQIGEAVPPLLGYYIAKALLDSKCLVEKKL